MLSILPSGLMSVLVVCACLAGCSSSSSSTPESPGIPVADGGGCGDPERHLRRRGRRGGSIELRITGGLHGRSLSGAPAPQRLHPLAATDPTSATIHVTGGATFTLDGTIDLTTYVFTITGSGYSFTSTTLGGVTSGTYTGPKGAGVFTAFNSPEVKSYCGTFAGDAMGVWNFAVNGTGAVAGSASDDKGNPDTLTVA